MKHPSHQDLVLSLIAAANIDVVFEECHFLSVQPAATSVNKPSDLESELMLPEASASST